MVSFDDLKGSTKSGQTGSNINCTGEGKVCFDVFTQGKARYILCKTNANRSFRCENLCRSFIPVNTVPGFALNARSPV